MMSILAVLLLTAAAPPANLDFSGGDLTHWEGRGFTFAAGQVVSSGGTGLLHRTFTVPPGVGAIRCRAAAVRPADCQPTADLDIVVEGSERRFAARLLRTAS